MLLSKRLKGAHSGGETTAYADLGAQAFLGVDLVGVSSWFARALPCLREVYRHPRWRPNSQLSPTLLFHFLKSHAALCTGSQ